MNPRWTMISPRRRPVCSCSSRAWASCSSLRRPAAIRILPSWGAGSSAAFTILVIGLHARFVRAIRGVRARGETRPVVMEELRRLSTWGERHRRLLARLTIARGLTLLVDAIGAALVWVFRARRQGRRHQRLRRCGLLLDGSALDGLVADQESADCRRTGSRRFPRDLGPLRRHHDRRLVRGLLRRRRSLVASLAPKGWQAPM